MNGSTESGPTEFWTRLRRRKVVQWGLVYVAGAWGFLQGLEYVSETFHWPEQIRQLSFIALLIGLPIVLVLAWYHGDRGQQRITTPEFAILTLLLLLGGGAFWYYEHASHAGSEDRAPTTNAAQRDATPTVADARPSIAVLPFENRSRVEDDAFFVDGIHDDILMQLSKISALRVISRTSVEQFRDTKLPMKTIAAQLGVSKILEGGVQRAGDRVRVTVQLIDAATDAHVWADNYDRELSAANIFAIQSELAAAIAGALKTSLTPGELVRTQVVPTQNLEAWEAYQLGRQRMAARTTAALADAEMHFQKAIELDSNFALAYVGLADTLRLKTNYGGAPTDAALTNADSAANTALSLDPNLAEGWTSAAGVAWSKRQYDRAERMFLKAIELNPNYAPAHQWFSGMLGGLGRTDEALAFAERARALDPLSAIINFNLGGTLESVGRFAEADVYYRKVIAIDPTSSGAYGNIGILNAYALNRFADAVPFLRKSIELEPGDIGTAFMLALVLSDLGEVSQASQITDDLLKRWPDDVFANSLAALVHVSSGDKDAAVKYAQKAFELDPQQLGGYTGSLMTLTYADLEKTDYLRARARFAKARPQMLSPEPSLDRLSYEYAIDLAALLQKTGESDRAKILLDRSEQVIRTMPRLGASGYGIADVRIDALHGDRSTALTALREAAKAGWRGQIWRYFRDFDPALSSIRNEPEFKSVFADIERDMAQQRARLAARPKDAPLELTEASR